MMNQSSQDADPWVIRTDFSNDTAWQAVCDQISTPQIEYGDECFTYVQFIADRIYADLDTTAVVHSLPDDYPGSLCFLVDAVTISNEEFPILVVGFYADSDDLDAELRPPKSIESSEIKTFRAIPATIQAIENNLSIANMDFEDFANSVDPDGAFRGFR